MKTKTYSPAKIRSASYDADANTIDIVWTTGAPVRRSDYDGEYDEVLCLEPGAVRLGRLNSGAPFLDTHQDGGLANVIGTVVPGSAKIEDGRGIAKIQLSRAASDADVIQKITDGVVRNVSVGYWTHASTRSDGDPPVITATDWEPLEISAVPIPADPGSQIRSADRKRPRDRQSPAQRAAAYARRLLGRPAQSSAQAHGAAEARKLKGSNAGTFRTERAKTADFDKEAVARGARATRRLLGKQA